MMPQGITRRKSGFHLLLVLGTVLGGVTACSDNKVPIIKMVAYDYVESLGPDKFVSHVWTIATPGDTLFINDQNSKHVIGLDNDLSVVGTIGKEGRGPGEPEAWPRVFM